MLSWIQGRRKNISECILHYYDTSVYRFHYNVVWYYAYNVLWFNQIFFNITNEDDLMKIPAFGTQGHIIYDMDGKYRFRVYTEKDFIDYDLIHSDLCVEIVDKDATFYTDDRGDRLDHSPATLGHQSPEPVAVYDSKELEQMGYTIKDCDPIDCKGTIYWMLKPELRKLQNE